MIEDPDRWAPAYAEAGAGSVTFHVEAAQPRCGSPASCAPRTRAPGWRSRPATPVEPYADLLGELDMLLVMTVEPGFGGQKFLDVCLPKIRRARELISAHGLEVWLQVDGGVSLETIERCAEAGADIFVAGRRSSRREAGRDGPELRAAERRAARRLISALDPGRGTPPHVAADVSRVWQAGPDECTARVLWGR